MFEVTMTGKNRNYGKKGERRLLSDSRLVYAIRAGLIELNNIKYVGSIAEARNVPLITATEELLPVKKINLIKTLESQNERIERLIKECNAVLQVNKKYLKLVKK